MYLIILTSPKKRQIIINIHLNSIQKNLQKRKEKSTGILQKCLNNSIKWNLLSQTTFFLVARIKLLDLKIVILVRTINATNH